MKNLLKALLLLFGMFLLLSIGVGILHFLNPELLQLRIGILMTQAIQSILLFGVTPLIAIKYIEKKAPITEIKMERGMSLHTTGIIILFALAAIPGVALFNEWNMKMQLPSALAALEEWMRLAEDMASKMIMRLVNVESPLKLISNIIVIAVIPAVCEEIMFRGWIQRWLNKRYNLHASVWIAAIIFSAIHFQFYGFIPRMLLGVAFGYIYVYTGTLWAPILAHFINNSMAVITGYITHNKISDVNFDAIGTGDNMAVGIASIAVCVALIMIIQNEKKKREKTITPEE